jgi:hypothetical protein
MGDYALHGSGTHVSETDDYNSWSAEQLASYFAKHGLGAYSQSIQQHKITGKLAPLLSDLDLKEMGIKCIGDRLRFRMLIDHLKRKVRHEIRSRCKWEGQERIFFSDTMADICTCWGFCPVDPSVYKLMSNHIKIKTVHPLRCGPVRLCCCHEYKISNVDLTNVADVDVNGVPAPCCERILCCALGKDILDIEIRGYGGVGNMSHKIILREGEGDAVAGLILNSAEESQKIDRD